MKVKRFFAIFLVVAIAITIVGCKNEEETSTAFDVNTTKQFITKFDSTQEDFFKAVYGVETIDEDKLYSCIGSMLDSVDTGILDNYSLILAGDDEENPKVEQIDYGFIYKKKEDTIKIVCDGTTLLIYLKNSKDALELRVKKLGDNSYALTLYDEESLSGLQAVFTRALGRVKINDHIAECQNIFELESFDNFAKDDGTGEFKSNE